MRPKWEIHVPNWVPNWGLTLWQWLLFEWWIKILFAIRKYQFVCSTTQICAQHGVLNENFLQKVAAKFNLTVFRGSFSRLTWVRRRTCLVGTPYIRQWNVWVAAEAKFDGFFSFLLQKGHGTSNSWPENFFRGPKKILSPPNWLFFGGSVIFPKLRAHFQNLHLLIIFSLPRKSSGNLQ